MNFATRAYTVEWSSSLLSSEKSHSTRMRKAYNFTPGVVQISLGSSNSAVIVNITTGSLPDVDDLLIIFRRYRPPLSVINDLALLYYQENRLADFERLLHTAKRSFRFEVEAIASVDFDGDSSKHMAKTYDMLGTYYMWQNYKSKQIQQSHRETSKIRSAEALFAEADKLPSNPQHVAARGFFFLYEKGNVDLAASAFDFAISCNAGDLVALLGRAMCHFASAEYKKALGLFRRIMMKTNFKCSPDIRVGIGHCFFKMKSFAKAKLAYERALALDPNHTTAKVGLAFCYLNMESNNVDNSENKKRAFPIIAAVLRENCGNDFNAINALADYYFYRKNYDECEKLALFSLSHSNPNNQLRCQAAYRLGCLHQVKGDFERAFEYYNQGTTLCETDPLPLYGVGQMYLYKKESTNAERLCKAESYLQKALLLAPNDLDTMKILAIVHILTSKTQEDGREKKRRNASSYLKKVAEGLETDVDSWIQYASALEGRDTRGALAAYGKASDIITRAKEQPVPFAIINNLGCLHFNLGNFEEARKFFESALNDVELLEYDNTDETSKRYQRALTIMIKYNLARAWEELSDYERARELYEHLLKDHKNKHPQSIIRLGVIFRNCGYKMKAEEKFKDALEMENDNSDSWTCLGNLHVRYSEYQPGLCKFERVLRQPASHNDVYCLCAMGNMYLSSIVNHPHQMGKQAKLATHAWKLFKSALQYDSKCMYAAQGIACLLAYQGFHSDAQHAFSMIRDEASGGDNPDVLISLGHIYVALKQYDQGVQLYKRTQRKFHIYELDANMWMYIARAHFLSGNFDEARRAAERARHLDPTSKTILYDLAVIMRIRARRQLTIPQNGFAVVSRARREMKHAHFYFCLVSSGNATAHAAAPADNNQQPPTDSCSHMAKRAQREKQECDDMLRQADYFIRKAREHDDQLNEQKRRHYEFEESIRKQNEEIANKRAAKEQHRKREIDNQRLTMAQKQKRLRNYISAM